MGSRDKIRERITLKAKAVLLLFIFLYVAVFSIHAQDDLEEDLALAFDEETVSIATGGDLPLSRAPAVASVITAEDIKAMGATNLDQVLETVPGFHVSLSSIRFSPVYSIRGIQTDTNPQVLVLMNGVPLTQLFQGDRGALSTLPVKDIARVEVIRGPGSAVYGADAFAGVINVITKSAQDIDGTEVGMRAASFDTKGTWLLYGERLGKFDLTFSIEYETTDGDKSRKADTDSQSIFDAAFGTNASQAPGSLDTRAERLDIRLGVKRDNWQLRLWNWRQDDLGVGPGLAQALDYTGRSDFNNYLVDLSYQNKNFAEHVDLKAKLSYMNIDSTSEQRLFPSGTVLPIGTDGNINPIAPNGIVMFSDGFIGNPRIFEEHTRFDLSSFYTGFDQHRLRLGAGAIFSELTSEESKNFGPGVIDGTVPVVNGNVTDVSNTPYVFVPNEDRTVYHVSLQDQWNFASDWDLTAGLRYDHYSDFGGTLNPRAALVWHPQYNLTTKLLYGSAFRPPSFQESFIQNNPVLLGNSKLDPETIETIELVFDYQPTFSIHTALNIFYYEIEDLIEFVVTSGGSQAQNVGNQKGRGLEWEVSWDVTEMLQLSGNYALQKAEDQVTQSDIPNAPQQQILLEADWTFLQDWQFGAQLNWVAGRKRAEGDPRDNINDYTLVNFVVRRQRLINNLELSVAVRNVFDNHAKEPSPYDPSAPNGAPILGDYSLTGRSIIGEISYRF